MPTQTYKILPELLLNIDGFSLIPIRLEDRHEIRRWRNDQISILRQSKPLTEKDQDIYFSEVVQKLFDQQYPPQLLFSFLYKGELIGYGGLVHIDWVNKNAEISFLTATERNSINQFFIDFKVYLELLLTLAFERLQFIKVHTMVYDLPQRRPYLDVIKDFGFIQEAHFKMHILVDGKMSDVFVFSRFNEAIK